MNIWSEEKNELIKRVRTALCEVREAAASPLPPNDVRTHFVDQVLDGAGFFAVLVKAREHGWEVPDSFFSSAQEWSTLVEDSMKSLAQSLADSIVKD